MGKPSFAAPGGWGFGEPCSELAWEAPRATAHRWQVGWSSCRVSRGGRDVLYPAPLCLHFAAGKTESERRGIDSKDTGYFSEHLFPVPPPAWHRAGATRPMGGPLPGPGQAPLSPWAAPPHPAQGTAARCSGHSAGVKEQLTSKGGAPGCHPSPTPSPTAAAGLALASAQHLLQTGPPPGQRCPAGSHLRE